MQISEIFITEEHWLRFVQMMCNFCQENLDYNEYIDGKNLVEINDDPIARDMERKIVQYLSIWLISNNKEIKGLLDFFEKNIKEFNEEEEKYENTHVSE